MSRIPHPIGKIAGIASKLKEQDAKNQIAESKAKLARALDELAKLEEKLRIEENEAANLKVEMEAAREAFNECQAGGGEGDHRDGLKGVSQSLTSPDRHISG